MKLDAFATVGENYTSDGVFANIGQMSDYSIKKFNLNCGIEFNLIDRDTKVLSGIIGAANYDLGLEKSELKAGIFYCFRPISSLINERNWGISIKQRLNHWKFELGSNFRSFKFNKNSIENFNIIVGDEKISEAWNLFYSVQYKIKDCESKWNAYVNLTNRDVFVIQHETNPMINFGLEYNFPDHLTKLYLDLWYQTAGFGNIRVNYFGYYFRFGALWKIT